MTTSGVSEDSLCKVLNSSDDASPETVGIVRSSHYSYDQATGVFTRIAGDNQIITTVQNTVIGNKIADYTNEAGVVKDINETVTTTTNTSTL
jgi:hypothetical protein